MPRLGRYYRPSGAVLPLERYCNCGGTVLPLVPTVLPLTREQYYRKPGQQPEQGEEIKTEDAPRAKGKEVQRKKTCT